jgi:hypothetical protein
LPACINIVTDPNVIGPAVRAMAMKEGYKVDGTGTDGGAISYMFMLIQHIG